MANKEYKRTKIMEYITNAKNNMETLKAVLPVLETFEGKVMNKRLATAVTKKTGMVAYFTAEYNLQHLEVWRTNYNDRLRIFLGYKGQHERFTMELFEDKNPTVAKYQEWIDKYEIALTKLDVWCKALEVIERMKKELEADADKYGVSGIIMER